MCVTESHPSFNYLEIFQHFSFSYFVIMRPENENVNVPVLLLVQIKQLLFTRTIKQLSVVVPFVMFTYSPILIMSFNFIAFVLMLCLIDLTKIYTNINIPNFLTTFFNIFLDFLILQGFTAYYILIFFVYVCIFLYLFLFYRTKIVQILYICYSKTTYHGNN
jgi:hypothetical protein